jgi:hypothetical protein
VVRTDWHQLDKVILASLEEGVLRQGWGDLEDQDLNMIGSLFCLRALAGRSAEAAQECLVGLGAVGE